MELLTLFSATFLNVFFLGLQQQVVVNQRLALAFTVSWGISGSNFLFTRLTANTADPWLAYLIAGMGGSTGIVCAIVFWQWFKHRGCKVKAADKSIGGFRPIPRVLGAS